MTAVKSAVFRCCLALWTVFIGGIVGFPAFFLQRRAAFVIQRWWGRGVLFLLRAIAGVRFEIIGREKRPPGDILIASKHQSAWDTVIFLLLDETPPAFVLKKELIKIPVYGWYCLKAGMLPIDRDGGALALRALQRLAKKRFAEGRSIVIFPEGTRMKPGEHQPYLSGVAGLYKILNVPVSPVAVNSGLFWPKAGLTGRRGVIRLEYLDPIPPGLDKRAFLGLLEARIEPATRRLEALGAASPL